MSDERHRSALIEMALHNAQAAWALRRIAELEAREARVRALLERWERHCCALGYYMPDGAEHVMARQLRAALDGTNSHKDDPTEENP